MQKKSNPFPIAAVFFLLNLVGSIFRAEPVRRAICDILWQMPYALTRRLARFLSYNYSLVDFWWVLSFLFLMVLCIALFIKRRNVFMVIAVALQCLIPLYDWGDNLLRIIMNIEYFEPKYDMLLLLTPTLDLCAMLVAVFMAIANIQKKSGPSKLAGIVNKLWFLPGVLYFTSVLTWGVYYSYLFGVKYNYVRGPVVSNIVTAIVPTVAWLMLGLWFKQCWKAEVTAAEAAEACIPAAPVYEEAPVYEAPVYVAPAPAEPAPVQAAPQKTTDALREYKQLLDDGVITQEEFDAKKKQLLGL